MVYFLKSLLIHLREREGERGRAQAGGEAEGEGEAHSPPSWEPDVGLNPVPGDHDPSQRQTLNDNLSNSDAP